MNLNITAVSRWLAGHRVHFLVLGAVFALAAFFRFWAAPLSSGPDVAQFWAFARVFEDHGLDFYRYAEATDGSFPYWGWGYVYPPVWLLILKGALLADPSSLASTSVIDESWRVAMKTPIILADLGIGALLYRAVPGSHWKKVLFASIWLLHPTAWYESAVFGQFDAIAAFFLLAAVIMFERQKDRLAFLFVALAFMTKQHTIFPIAMLLAVNLQRTGPRIFARNCVIPGVVVLVFSIPFLVTGNFSDYVHALFSPQWDPDYQRPLTYAFSGSGSFLTYMHDAHGWDTKGLFSYNLYVLVALLLGAMALTWFREVTPARAALAGVLLFIGISYQVNYQYLVLFIPLAILVAGMAKLSYERYAALGLALLPAVWLWLFDVSFWFRAYQPSHPDLMSLFDRIGWTAYMSARVYVSFAVILMFASLIYVMSTFMYWTGLSPAAAREPELAGDVIE